jgi:hypothetical protein
MGGLEADETVAVEARIAEELLRLTRAGGWAARLYLPRPTCAATRLSMRSRVRSLTSAIFRRSSCRSWVRPGCGRWWPIDGTINKAVRVLWGVAPHSAHLELGFARRERGRAGFLVRRIGRAERCIRCGRVVALCCTGSGEILGRHTSTVGAVAAVVLSDGRPVAVTGSGDATVRIWDPALPGAVGYPDQKNGKVWRTICGTLRQVVVQHARLSGQPYIA